MITSQTRFKGGPRGRTVTFFLGALGVLFPTLAQAHFELVAPACYSMQDSSGLPQKSAPCGQADPGTPVQMSGAVTTLYQGQSFTLTIDEKVFHPGHYRVAIAADQSSLPMDPSVTVNGTDPCGSADIEALPTLPVLADNVFPHTAMFTSPQTTQIQLPPNLTCTNCVIQVIEFMSQHGLNNPGGCFYHHCANVNIVPMPDAGTSGDGGPAPPDASSAGTPGSMPSGCGCHLAPAATSSLASFSAMALTLGLLFRRRRSAKNS